MIIAGYQPLKITGMTSGLIQSREEFLLPDDAYPVLQNAYVWRERLKRKQGCSLLGRLQRNLTNQSLGSTDGSGAFSGNIKTILSLEATGQISPGTLVITVGSQTFTDAGNGTLTGGGGGTINYSTMQVSIQTSPSLPATPIVAAFSYYPGLPVMGLRAREIESISTTPTIAFDTKYAYQYVSGWSEWLPGTTWTGTDSNFFWSTNYWNSNSNKPIFWVTNFSSLDPIKYTDGTSFFPLPSWFDFAPQIDAGPNYLVKCLAMLPFRGRMVVFNTFEGPSNASPFPGDIQYPQRIRWAAIGNPFTTVSSIITSVNTNAWRDDIRGQGGFLDIPTSESITAVGFVRDNLVIYCERSTWQLRYTQSNIVPFTIERVNSELGTGSLFSAVQFDTSLVGIGDKGVVECDSYQSVRIDPQIPDLVFSFNTANNGSNRIQGVRDFINKLAFWTFPYSGQTEFGGIYPNYRLVYNYENQSWAIFTDSYTCLGTFQPLNSKIWSEVNASWQSQNYIWIDQPMGVLDIIGGNQQGYTEYLDYQTYNDVSLTITNITSNNTTPTIITVPNHNLQEGAIIQIYGIPSGTGYSSLNWTPTNGKVFYVSPVNANDLELWLYNSETDDFDIPELDPSQSFVGYGQVAIRDNFIIQSKKFNFMDEGQNIQLGYIDVLMNSTSEGAISLNLYLDYNNSTPINILDQNENPATGLPDTFFNSVVNTSNSSLLPGAKNWQRIFCPVRGAFITVVWTLSNSQMISNAQQSDVQIDAQVLWLRRGGRLQSVNI